MPARAGLRPLLSTLLPHRAGTPRPGGMLRPLLTALLLLCALSAPLPREPLDMSDDAQLAQALELRAGGPGGKHIILFGVHAKETGSDLSWMWFHLAQNLMLHLATTQGGLYDHYIAITADAATCELLHRRWPLGNVTTPSCAFASAPYNVTKDYGAAGLCVGRYHTLARVAERGYDVLLIDADFLFVGDVYALLNAPPLDAYTAVVLRESPVNSGTVFVRGSVAHPQGGTLWVMREVSRRTEVMSLARDAHGGDPGFYYDQGLLGFALRVAQNKLSEWDWSNHYLSISDEARKHAFWTQHPQPEPDKSPNFEWRSSAERYSMPNASCPVHDAAACARFAAFQAEHNMVNVSIGETPACTPADSAYFNASVPCERIAAGPTWLWSHGAIASLGWLQSTAAVHMLAIEKTWHPTMVGSHAGRFALVAAQGLIDPRLMPMPPKPPLMTPPAPAWTAAMNESFELATRAIVAAFDTGLASGETPVFHEIPCNARWIERSTLSRSGRLDWRIVETPDGRCWPAQAGWDTCFVHKHFLWAFQLERAHESLVRRETLNNTDAARKACYQWVAGWKAPAQ